METFIVICLLVVIILLLEDKFIIKKRSITKANQEKDSIILPEIMGTAKPVTRLSMPNTATEGQNKKQEDDSDNFDHKIEKKDLNKQIPQEELDEVFGVVPDLKEEEEEWNRYGVADDEDGFAMGVTFEELNAVGTVLRGEISEASLEKQAVDIVHKIQGTELFSLLENSIEGASRKIAMLLDRSLPSNADSSSSIMRKNELDNFDMGEFV